MPAPRLFDCVIYNGEPILELRFQVLDAWVDRFVIIESEITFQGNPKAPRFDPDKYRAWAHKIDYHLLRPEDFSACKTAWERETLQRNAVLLGLQDAAPDDLVMLSDVDEIPDPNVLPQLIGRPSALRQLSFAYYANMLCNSEPYWFKGTRVVPASALGLHTPESIRLRFDACFPEGQWIDHGGWHFTYLGGVEAIRQKITEFSHHELNKEKLRSVASIASQIKARLDIFYRPDAFSVVKADSVGSSQMTHWFLKNDFLFPAGDDGVSVAQVLERHERQNHLIRRLRRRILKIRQKFRRALARRFLNR